MNSALTIHPKVASATLAGSLTAIVIYCLQRYANTDIPPTVAAAITTIFAAVLGWLAPIADDLPHAITLPTEPPEDGTTEPTAGQKAIEPAK